MSVVDRKTDESYHDVGNGSFIHCEYHDRVWEGKTTEAKRETARQFFLKLSPYAPGNPAADEKNFINETHHSSDEYCGGKNYIIQSVVYEKCPNKPRGFTSPFQYHRIGSSSNCFLKGRGTNLAPMIKPDDQKEQKEPPVPSPVPSPVPPAIYPLAPSPPLPPPPPKSHEHRRHHSKNKKHRHHDRHSKNKKHRHHDKKFGSNGQTLIMTPLPSISAQPPTQQPTQPPIQPPMPTQPPTQPPAQQPVQTPMPTQPPSQPPSQQPVQTPIPTQPPAQQPVQTPMPTQPPAQPPAQPPVQPSFDLKEQTLPALSVEIPESSKRQDQVITHEEMEQEWNEFLKSMQSYITDNVYTPLKEYYDTKIKDKTSMVPSDEYSSVLSCVKKLELDIRRWVEMQKTILFQTAEGHTKAVFNEEKENLMTDFKIKWVVELANCTKKSIDQMKQMLKQVNRQVKPPLDVTEKQTRIMKITNIRRDPDMCGPDQNKVYEDSISKLLKQLQDGVQFDKIEEELTPVTDVDPYLSQAWKLLTKTYDIAIFKPRVENEFDQFYNQLKLDWKQDSVFCDLVVQMDKPYQLEKSLNALDLTSPVNSARKDYIWGPFKTMLMTCYAPHKVTLNMYMENVFPKLASQWLERDIQQVLSKDRMQRIRSNLDIMLNAYLEKYVNNATQPMSQDQVKNVISWLSQVMVIAHNQPTISLEQLVRLN
jgi:hypothetical protein